MPKRPYKANVFSYSNITNISLTSFLLILAETFYEEIKNGCKIVNGFLMPFKNDVWIIQIAFKFYDLLQYLTCTFELFYIKSISQKYSLNAWIVQNSILVLQFFSCIIISYLMISLVILLSILMIRVSTLSVIKILIFDNNHNWLLNLNLTFNRLYIAAISSLFIPILEKHNIFYLIDSKQITYNITN